MLAGPEVCYLIAQYDAASEAKDANENGRHHGQTEQDQRVVFEKVDKLYKVMKDIGNPFQEESENLLTLDTKNIAHLSAAEMVATHYKKGRIHFKDFMKGLECEEECSVYEQIKRNKMEFFLTTTSFLWSKAKGT